MLIQRIIFAVLGTTLYLCAVAFGDDVVVLQGVIGNELRFPMSEPTHVSKCVVTSNTRYQFSLVPASEARPRGVDQHPDDVNLENCGMRITSLTTDQLGVWEIRAYTSPNRTELETEFVKEFQVQLIPEADSENETELPTEIFQNVDVFPSRMISIFPGNSMTLRLLNHYDNLTSCIATSPDEHKFDVLNTVTTISDEIRSFDQCGVIVRVNDSHAGNWRLDATIENNENEKLNYFGNFYVQVQNLDATYPKPTVTHVRRGAPASITVGPSEALSCQLKNPNGQELPIQSGNCEIDIPVVTNAHEGFWTATYSLHGQMNVVEKMTEVVAYDDHSLNATVTTLDNGDVNLLCRVRTDSLSFCQFVTPNGIVLNVFEAIGYDRYLSHEYGTRSTSTLTEGTHECGMTILKPDYSDVGNWKCILGTSSGVSGSMLNVAVSGVTPYEYVAASHFEETVYVVKGDSFTIGCNANAILKYCWMGSPNGTAYSVSSTGISPTTLEYVGMGLSLGECGAVIPAAKDTDEGEWKCGMGVSNGQEVRSIIRVIVTDTLLMPDRKNVTIRHDRAQLSCSLIPGHEESIDYCRWIRPSGFGFERWTTLDYNKGHYTTFSTTNRCHLEIKKVKEFRDTGNWTCVAGLVGSSLEVSATIQVLKEPRGIFNSSGSLSSWCFGIGLGFFSIILATFLIVGIYTKLRFKEKLDLPPRYEDQKVMPSVTTLHTQP